MQFANSLQKIKHNCHKIAAFLWLFFDFRVNVLEASYLEEGEVSKSRLLQCKNFVKIPLHTKIEKKMLTKT